MHDNGRQAKSDQRGHDIAGPIRQHVAEDPAPFPGLSPTIGDPPPSRELPTRSASGTSETMWRNLPLASAEMRGTYSKVTCTGARIICVQRARTASSAASEW